MTDPLTVHAYEHRVEEAGVYSIRRPLVLHIEAESLDAARAEYERTITAILSLASEHGLIRLREERDR